MEAEGQPGTRHRVGNTPFSADHPHHLHGCHHHSWLRDMHFSTRPPTAPDPPWDGENHVGQSSGLPYCYGKEGLLRPTARRCCRQGWHCGLQGCSTSVDQPGCWQSSPGFTWATSPLAFGDCRTMTAAKAAQRCPQVREVGANLRLCIQRETAAACSARESRAWAVDGAKGTYGCRGHPGKSVPSN